MSRILQMLATLLVALAGFAASTSTGLVIKPRNTTSLDYHDRREVVAGSVGVSQGSTSSHGQMPLKARDFRAEQPGVDDVVLCGWLRQTNARLVKFHIRKWKAKIGLRSARRAMLLGRQARRILKRKMRLLLCSSGHKSQRSRNRPKRESSIPIPDPQHPTTSTATIDEQNQQHQPTISPAIIDELAAYHHSHKHQSTPTTDQGRALSATKMFDGAPSGVVSLWNKIAPAASAVAAFVPLSVICCMVPGRSNHPRLPPNWSPEQESSYPFAHWSRDVLIWSITSDMDASRKAASVVSVLQGSGRDFARNLPPMTLIQGGRINGVDTDPLTYLMYQLSARFARLGEEVRIGSIGELMTFARQPHERIDLLLQRFESLRIRAQEQGGLALSVPGISWLLIRAIGVTETQLMTLLAPFQGTLPANEAQFEDLKAALRRMGHIIEGAPGNLASVIRSGSNHQSAYLMQDGPHTHDASDMSWNNQHSAQSWSQPSEYNVPHAQNVPAQNAPAQNVYLQHDEGYDTGTDTDTSSDCGDQGLQDPATQTMSMAEQAESLFWAYSKAKKAWRSFMRKPTRKVRRFTRRLGKGGKKGKGSKGFSKGKISNTFSFLASLPEEEIQSLFPALHHRKSSGKGKGRSQNPLGPNGERMRCHGCGSDRHLVAKCPNRSENRSETHASNLFIEVQDSSTPGVITGPFFMVQESDDQPQIPDPWLNAQFPFSQSSSLQSQTSGADAWSVWNTRNRPGTRVGGILNPEPPLPGTYRSRSVGVDIADQSQYMASVFQGLNSYVQPDRARPSGSRDHGPMQPMPEQNQQQPIPFLQQPMNPNPTQFRPSLQQPLHEAATGVPPYPTGPPMSFGPQQPSVNIPSNFEQPQQPPMENPINTDQPRRQTPEPSRRQPDLDADERELLTQDIHRGSRTLRIEVPPPTLDQWAQMPEFHMAMGTRPLEEPRFDHPIRSEVVGALDPFSAQIIQNFHLAQESLGLPAADRPRGSAEAPRYVHPNALELDRLHESQIAMRDRNRDQRARTSESSDPVVAPASATVSGAGSTHPSILVYTGDEHSCPICLEGYAQGDELIRLLCRHTCHAECWTQALINDEHQACPCCRGAGAAIATFNYISPGSIETPRARQHSGTGSEFGTPPAFPWWPEIRYEERIYHSSTSLPGHLSIVVDPGAYTNLAGEMWAKRQATAALENGRRSFRTTMRNPMSIKGVGNGSQGCSYTGTMPIAVPDTIRIENDPGSQPIRGQSRLMTFEAPVVEGSGRDLPPLLGLKSLTSHHAVLECSPGKEMLTLTREGNYEINWGPGTVHIPLQRAPSGHLVFRTDAFGSIQPQPNVGLRETTIGLYSNLQVGPSDRNPAGLEHAIHPSFRREVHNELGTDGSPRRNFNHPGDRRAAGSIQYSDVERVTEDMNLENMDPIRPTERAPATVELPPDEVSDPKAPASTFPVVSDPKLPGPSMPPSGPTSTASAPVQPQARPEIVVPSSSVAKASTDVAKASTDVAKAATDVAKASTEVAKATSEGAKAPSSEMAAKPSMSQRLVPPKAAGPPRPSAKAEQPKTIAAKKTPGKGAVPKMRGSVGAIAKGATAKTDSWWLFEPPARVDPQNDPKTDPTPPHPPAAADSTTTPPPPAKALHLQSPPAKAKQPTLRPAAKKAVAKPSKPAPEPTNDSGVSMNLSVNLDSGPVEFNVAVPEPNPPGRAASSSSAAAYPFPPQPPDPDFLSTGVAEPENPPSRPPEPPGPPPGYKAPSHKAEAHTSVTVYVDAHGTRRTRRTVTMPPAKARQRVGWEEEETPPKAKNEAKHPWRS